MDKSKINQLILDNERLEKDNKLLRKLCDELKEEINFYKTKCQIIPIYSMKNFPNRESDDG